MCHAFLFCICICMCNRIHLVYAHFSSSAVVGCRPLARQIFRSRLSSTIFALIFISFFFFLFPFASCYSCKRAYYTDEFLLWLHLAAAFSLLFSLSSSRLLLLLLLSMLFYYCYKKTEPGRRTNECRKPLYSLLSSYSVISHNYAPVMFSRLIYMVYRDMSLCAHFSFFFFFFCISHLVHDGLFFLVVDEKY